MKINLLLSIFFFILLSLNAQILKYPINSGVAVDQYPAISIDDKTLIFISDRDGKNQLYQTTQNADSTWTNPIPIESINKHQETESNLRDPSLSYDGQTLYFSATFNDTKGNLDIYFSKKAGGSWGPPVNIGAPINTEKDEEGCSISGDDKYLLFTRDFNNPEYTSFKCRQIFSSSRNEDGSWTKPEILPEPINGGCDATAWICADNRTILLSSVRDEKSTFDLYYTRRLSKNVWIIPIPIGAANTELHELHPSISSNGDYLYFHRKEATRKQVTSKIYKVKLEQGLRPQPTVTIEGKIIDKNTGSPLLAKVKVSDPNTSSFIVSAESNPSTGNYKVILNRSKKYLFEFFRDGYSYDYYVLDEAETNTANVNKDINLFSNVDLILNVFDKEIFEPLKSEIVLMDAYFNEIIQTKIIQEQPGRYRINLPVGKNFNIISKAENFISDTLSFVLKSLVQYSEFERDIELEPIKEIFEINVADIETDMLMDVEIVITNLEKNEVIVTTAEKNEDGNYVIKLRKGDKYEVNVKSPKGYAYYNTTIDMASDKATEKLDVKLTPLKARTKITLNNITFETNSADLNVTSFSELDRLVQLMKDNPDMKIEISAHTDDVGSDRYNIKLSEKRAQTVIEYLQNNQIMVEQLIAKGYGESSPLVPNTNEENRAINRRVELKVIDIDTNTEDTSN